MAYDLNVPFDLYIDVCAQLRTQLQMVQRIEVQHPRYTASMDFTPNSSVDIEARVAPLPSPQQLVASLPQRAPGGSDERPPVGRISHVNEPQSVAESSSSSDGVYTRRSAFLEFSFRKSRVQGRFVLGD